ncbi:MobP2 family relaxase [Bacillus altitudinis]|uniref:MobP2 family relaxase n=1 Tax=Bacillus altitudinis TaxID=293387 RepID=UPI00064CC1D5|nr:MobP2 family relaxase [Bacillus altitudinis]KLV14952.1 hypothetical protein ABW03_19225 [Bacillus altitudinis]
MTNAGVVLVSKFVSGGSTKFAKYVNYIDREEAVRTDKFQVYNINNFDGYNNYMGNPEKSSGIFTANKDKLTVQEKEKLKDLFKTAQENDSVMWQDVISFDNKWLEEHGIYNSKNGWVNESAIQRSIRKGMDVLLKEEQIQNSAVWSAAIHFNTDNIHVHVAIVEPNPTREYRTYENKQTGEMYQARRGSRKLKTLDKMKSAVANKLLDRDKSLAKITQLIHSQIAPKDLDFKPNLDFKMLKMYQQIYNNLPSDRRLWKYNNNALAEVRPQINRFIDHYIEKYHSNDFKDLLASLKDEAEFRKSVYGNGENHAERYKDYEKNKVKELYAKLGNSLLKEMNRQSREFDPALKKKHAHSASHQEKYKKFNRADLKNIKKIFAEDFERYKAKRKYQELQRDMEYER